VRSVSGARAPTERICEGIRSSLDVFRFTEAGGQRDDLFPPGNDRNDACGSSSAASTGARCRPSPARMVLGFGFGLWRDPALSKPLMIPPTFLMV